MHVALRSKYRLSRVGCVILLAVWPLASSLAQTEKCAVVEPHPETPASLAYGQGQYSHAEDLYGQAVNGSPQDLKVGAALVQTLLHEGEVQRAASQVNKMLAADPHSAVTLTAQAELQLHQGQPWLTLQTLKAAEVADRCYARLYLIRSYALRIDSMYATERAEIQKAYDIDPTDPDIRHAFLSVVSPAHEIEGIHEGLATMKDLDEDTRQKAQANMEGMMQLLTENSQTCKVQPSVESATIPLTPFYLDPTRVDGYRLDVQLPRTKVRLQVDTAASGLYITRAMAELNGLQPDPSAPQQTVHADKITIGPLEFRDCIVGVSNTPFAGKSDGFIGTDMFASYLITLNQPNARLVLDPLPKQAGILPGDRMEAPELRGFSPVYHRQQFLMEPVTLNNKERRLFVLDTGIRFSTMTPGVAHSVSTMKVNFTNPMQTVSGATMQVYREIFDMQFANVALYHANHVLQFDPSAIEKNSGLQIAGMLGFDMLHSQVLHLDYRDGLVKLESPGDAGDAKANVTARASLDEEMVCPPIENRTFPTQSAIAAKVVSTLDSSRLKPGKEITVKVENEYTTAKCTLPAGSLLTGHVTVAGPSKGGGTSELALVFDRGECEGHGRGGISLKVIGLVAPPDQYESLHSALPAQVAGGVRSTVSVQVGYFDDNLNPGGPPHTIHAGIVTGYPKVKLDPVGGPACSAKFTSTEPNVRLWVGSELLLAMMVSQ
jgi:hypothetical protein